MSVDAYLTISLTPGSRSSAAPCSCFPSLEPWRGVWDPLVRLLICHLTITRYRWGLAGGSSRLWSLSHVNWRSRLDVLFGSGWPLSTHHRLGT